MSATQSLPPRLGNGPAITLVGIYARVTIGYLLVVCALWQVGLEAIYRHPFPFYGSLSPIFTTLEVPALTLGFILLIYGLAARELSAPPRGFYIGAALSLVVAGLALLRESSLSGALASLSVFRWYALTVSVFAVSLFALIWALKAVDWFGPGPNTRETKWMLAGLAVFAFVFPATVAMLRDGPLGISQAYMRSALEYITDVGLGGSIRGLFQDYATIHPYLSMHSQVHPPGPIAILWVLSYVAGREPMGLSLASMAFGALSVFPMYLWTRELFERRIALTCTLLYTLVPSIVIFTATSADITFLPFTLTTLYLFQRALNRSSIPHALAAGVGFGLMSIISFSLISVGVYFGFIGLLRLTKSETRFSVIQTAALMLIGLGAFHGALWWWTGFDVLEVFRLSKEKFDTDQSLLEIYDPRLPAWAWKFANPVCWFFYAGIPVSVLFILRLRHSPDAHRALFYAFALALLTFDILYLARGEGERSAMYIMPFLVIPAGHLLHELGDAAKSPMPLVATVAFLGIQSWAIESILYTYW